VVPHRQYRVQFAKETYMHKAIPEIAHKPIVGNLLDFRSDRLGLFMRVSRTCGDIGAYYMGRSKYILINSALLAHSILVDHADDFDKTHNFRRVASPLLGNGLLTSENSFHHRQRKLIAPAFQKKRIGVYAGVMAEYSERMCASWSEGQEINVHREMVRLILWIVGKTLFSADVLSEADDLGGALTDAIHGFNSQVRALVPLTIEWPTLRNLGYRRAVIRLNRAVLPLIAERRASGKDHGDLLSMLLQVRYGDGTSMSDQQIRDEVLNMFMPGHETSATALTWTWYLLSQHPDVYARMRVEVDSVLAGRTPAFDDVPRLPYTLQVFKEGLRMYPSVYMFSRRALRDIDIDGYHFPAGSILIFSPYAMHRREDYYPEPERFNPNRFSRENEARLPSQAYMPFGAGKRICIGNHYAMLNGHMVLATLAQRVVLDTSQRQPERDPMVTLRPKQAVLMTIRHRKPVSRQQESRPPDEALVPAGARQCPFSGATVN
jgi:cytochrome P450